MPDGIKNPSSETAEEKNFSLIEGIFALLNSRGNRGEKNKSPTDLVDEKNRAAKLPATAELSAVITNASGAAPLTEDGCRTGKEFFRSAETVLLPINKRHGVNKETINRVTINLGNAR